jgi:hypothetical protein
MEDVILDAGTTEVTAEVVVWQECVQVGDGEPICEVETPAEIIGAATATVAAFKGGEHAVAVGLVLTLVVTALRRINVLGLLKNRKLVPWFAVLLSLLTWVSGALAQGVAPGTVLVQAVSSGLISVGFWQLFKQLPVVQRLLSGKTEETTETAE